MAYTLMPRADFPRAILEACPPSLAVAAVPRLMWSGHGSPRRVEDEHVDTAPDATGNETLAATALGITRVQLYSHASRLTRARRGPPVNHRIVRYSL